MKDGNPRTDPRPVVAHLVNSLTNGGTERTLLSLLHALDRRFTRHVVVTLRDAGPGAARLPDDVACHAIGARNRVPLSFIGVARALRFQRPKIIHARNTSCWTDATLAAMAVPKAQLILGFHGLDRLDGLDGKVSTVARWASRRGALFTSVSRHGAEMLERRCEVPMSRIQVLPNGVDAKVCSPCSALEQRRIRGSAGLPIEAVLVGSAASMTPIKRLDLLLDAAAPVLTQNPSLHVVLIGTGPLRAQLRTQAERLSLAKKVHFLGEREDVQNLLPALDAYVCSSDFEAVSNAMLEAMACALPVITTRVGDHETIIREGREGYIVPTGEVRKLGEALRTLCRDPDLRHAVGRAARKRALSFSFDRTIRAYESYYQNLLSARPFRRVPSASDSLVESSWPQAI